MQAGKNVPALSTLRASADGEVNGKMTGTAERLPYSFHRREEGRNFMVFDSCTSSLPPFSGWRTMRGAAALDAESAKAPEFHQRPPPDRPRNRLQHRVQRVFRLPGSNVLPQLTLELPDKLCFIHRPPSMTCPISPVKRQRRALIPATIPIQMPPSVPVCEFPPCPRGPAPLRFRGNASPCR